VPNRVCEVRIRRPESLVQRPQMARLGGNVEQGLDLLVSQRRPKSGTGARV